MLHERALPSRVGPWRVEKLLGVGGMGAVYLGRRAGEVAAVKVIHDGLSADETFRSRFRREVSIAGRVRGRYVARLVNAGDHYGTLWHASEYVAGETLLERVRRAGPLSASQAVDLARHLAFALGEIHAAGVIHRDLKPANVVLGDCGPVVIDFGIASAADMTSMTSTNQILGSAGFMAPEQYMSSRVDASADVFAWAATVVYGATGQSPFGTGPQLAIAQRSLSGPATLDSVPSDIRPLIQRCLSRNPVERPTVSDLAELLQLTGDLEPTAAGGMATAATGTRTTAKTTEIGVTPWIETGGRSAKRWVAGVYAAALACLIAAVTVGTISVVQQLRTRGPDAGATGSASQNAVALTTSPSAGPGAGSAASPVSVPSLSEASASSDGGEGPLFSDFLDPRSPQDTDRLGKFLLDHQFESVRLSVSWDHAGHAYVRASPRGYVQVDSHCVGVPKAGCGLVLSVPGADRANLVDISHSAAGGILLSGAFVVSSVSVGNGGFYSVELRPQLPGDFAPTPTKSKASGPPKMRPLAGFGGTQLFGYGPVKLGMTREQLLGTGVATLIDRGGGCATYDLSTGGRATISPRLKRVVYIEYDRQMATSQGIHLGSTLRQVQAAYPGIGPDYDGFISVPIGDQVSYLMVFNGLRVAQLFLTSDLQDCAG